MHLLEVQIPKFRVLKDIDIVFEKEFFPKIFPLGSLNGGGKSTLLQLIFCLLHCSVNYTRRNFLQNLLQSYEMPADKEQVDFAHFKIVEDDKVVSIDFSCCTMTYLDELVAKAYPDDKNIRSSAFFELESAIKEFNDISRRREEEYESEFKKETDRRYDGLKIRIQQWRTYAEKILSVLQSQKLIYATNFVARNSIKSFLLCSVQKMEFEQANEFLDRLSQKTFLSGPAGQAYLFFPQDIKENLFRKESGYKYYQYFQKIKSELPGFSIYDLYHLAGNLAGYLLQARDKDFREALRSETYGSNYQTLSRQINALTGQKVILSDDFSSIVFQKDVDGKMVELSPGDLSHGELKRLALYSWLKGENIKDSIVLIDEIELALHPDWQYQIVADLKEWESSNQYILATHSYELCQALTPAHVKEIEPKLLKKEG